jgi:hypothetical protein
VTKHPGKTPAQRRILDEIGCGNHSPVMAKATCDKLLRDGLVVELSPDERPFIGAITFQIRRFEMPIPVHMQWCQFQSEQEA